MTLNITSNRRARSMGILLGAALSVLIISLSATLAQPTTAQPPELKSPEAAQVEAGRLAKSAATLLAQAVAQQAAFAQAATQPAPPPQTIAIPAEIRDAVISLCMALITAGIATGLAWMRSHLAFMKEAGANAAITSSAQGLGALLEQELAKQGRSLSSVSISDPNVAAAAQKLIASYPEWGPLVGLTPDVAERKVLAGAIQQSVVPIVPAPTVTVVQPTPPPVVVEVAATPDPLRREPTLQPLPPAPPPPVPPTPAPPPPVPPPPIRPGTIS